MQRSLHDTIESMQLIIGGARVHFWVWVCFTYSIAQSPELCCVPWEPPLSSSLIRLANTDD